MIKYYWDSCVFISRIQGDPARIDVLQHITDEAAQDKIQIVTSTFTIAEVCKLSREDDEALLEAEAEEIAKFFDNPYIYLVQVSRGIAIKAASLSRKHGVKPADAIQLATAMHANCQIVHTYDESKLLKLNGIAGVPPLTIIKPAAEIQKEMFEINCPEATEQG